MRKLTKQSAENRLECIIRVISGYHSGHFKTFDEMVRWYENHVEMRRLVEASKLDDEFKQDSVVIAVYYVKRMIVKLGNEGMSPPDILRFLWTTSLLIEGDLNAS